MFSFCLAETRHETDRPVGDLQPSRDRSVVDLQLVSILQQLWACSDLPQLKGWPSTETKPVDSLHRQETVVFNCKRMEIGTIKLINTSNENSNSAHQLPHWSKLKTLCTKLACGWLNQLIYKRIKDVWCCGLKLHRPLKHKAPLHQQVCRVKLRQNHATLRCVTTGRLSTPLPSFDMRWRSLVYRFSRFHHRDLCPAGLKRITSKTAQRRQGFTPQATRLHVHPITHNYDQMLQQTRFHFNCVATGKGYSCENTLCLGWKKTPKNMEIHFRKDAAGAANVTSPSQWDYYVAD